MRKRCSLGMGEHRLDWPLYAGRGIVVCERWNDFEAFLADMGDCPEGLTLDRIDVNGNYEPSNCRWATPLVQHMNRRNTVRVEWEGVSVPLKTLCDRYTLDYQAAYTQVVRLGRPIIEVVAKLS